MRILTFSLLLLLIMSCGENKLSHGTVTDKVYEEAYDSTTYIPITNHCGTNCTFTTYLPSTQHHKAVWKLKLKECDTDTEKCKERYLHVSQSVYESTRIGDVK